MAAREDRTPMILVVLIETCDFLLHRMLREVGRHHLMIESVMAKQTPDAITSGSRTE